MTFDELVMRNCLPPTNDPPRVSFGCMEVRSNDPHVVQFAPSSSEYSSKSVPVDSLSQASVAEVMNLRRMVSKSALMLWMIRTTVLPVELSASTLDATAVSPSVKYSPRIFVRSSVRNLLPPRENASCQLTM